MCTGWPLNQDCGWSVIHGRNNMKIDKLCMILAAWVKFSFWLDLKFFKTIVFKRTIIHIEYIHLNKFFVENNSRHS